MSKTELFQKSILESYIEKQDQRLIEERWKNYQQFLQKKEQIKTWIETDYQVGFLEDIFENCLGYISKTSSTNEHFTLDREKKNEGNAQKADGALVVDNDVIAVIELKDLKTKDLDKKYSREESAVRQAFGYLNYQPSAKYVIVSNFNELRFYFEKADKHEKFMLFDLDLEGFKKLHTLLSYESISKGMPLEIKKNSVNFEEEISDKLYKDYTVFRTELFENIVNNNPTIDKVKLLNLTQKLIDRIIFILFAEDSIERILEPNTINKIITTHDANIVGNLSLYDFYKIYFEAINKGNSKLDIGAYNGGLFAEDSILDSLIIDDSVLDAQAKILSAYNFGSDISVNILGHIFEKSITALEEITAQIQDDDYDKKKSQQKIDGAFYTPEYITKYIVDSTLGKLCEDKRIELNIEDIETPLKLGKLNKKEKVILENIYSYREWLLNIKIVDPSCGSGAFLNQALDFLMDEHKYIDENRRLYENELMGLYDIESDILKNNLYGVDINEGAVEIAKLSLWLKTATKGKPLIKLAEKIKVGNSLIDDKNVVDNAFIWEEEFPEVFEQGGFDVVIGNPPYVSTKQIKKLDREFFWKIHKDLLISEMDLYEIFLYQSISKHLNINGLLGFITPNSYYTNKSFSNLRNYMIANTHIIEIIDFPFRFFPFKDVNTETSIIICKKTKLTNQFTTKLSTISKNKLNISFLIDDNVKVGLIESLQQDIQVFYKNKIIIKQTKALKVLLNSKKVLGDYLELHKGWMSVPKKTTIGNEVIESGIFTEEEILKYNLKGICSKYLEGRDIHRYYIDEVVKYVNISDIDKKTLTWHSASKLVLQRIVGQNKNKIFATYDDEKYIIFPNANLVNIKDNTYDIRFFLSIINSKLISYFYNIYYGESNTNLTKSAFEMIPIPDISSINQEEFIQATLKVIELTQKLHGDQQKFIKRYLNLEKVPKKLKYFEQLSFNEFADEYKKAKKLKFSTKLEEDDFLEEWEGIFEKYSKKALEVKSQIDATDKEIDKMVYELYDLTTEEIKIIEENI